MTYFIISIIRFGHLANDIVYIHIINFYFSYSLKGFSDSARYYFMNLHRKYKGSKSPKAIRFTNDRNCLRTTYFILFRHFVYKKAVPFR